MSFGLRTWDDPLEIAMARLVALATDDAWSVETAAAKLRAWVPEDSVLLRARNRVKRAMVEGARGTSERGASERAAATIEAALKLGRLRPDGAAASPLGPAGLAADDEAR